ncbi:type II toxin-antitoxin system Phd/YefM family antitoxin [Campylobacter sp. RM12327]|uniref:type II toxin-antitoxin system Phd/YefM family antitoxin n=1 Tax=Campylobacter sputorum TaxID=206 RepID=UPI000B78ADB4|nr:MULTISPECIES: type II toxin-antitoxin system Phd/YefM family antitoxin [Campylobacter]ASM39301.1 putative toxin-antitoxin system, antitoxin component, Phd/YefM family [Campylobacter sputorum]MBE7358470.1 type II toxin-antitoxin system Phd/YefM family antitoxin [Campylobacter sp. RM11302]MBF6669355.1 type II toxin-antitoxin system Phd/YefM family antitoxin [Campylobacter sp. RM12327]MBF6674623.1 type II toxin-antitoxin system Phd/YefM family antitoxin [Campylobacter sp. RM13538]MBF6676130.1 
MPSFNKDEIYTATEVVRNFASVMKKVDTGELGRVIIVKNSKFQAVLLSMKEYERLQNAVTLLEQIYSNRKRDEIGS